MHKAIAKKNFEKAKELIKEGIEVAEKKKHPGTVDQWRMQLLDITVLEKDIKSVRALAKYFAFERVGFSLTHYKQWKSTYPTEEWKRVIDEHIANVTREVTAGWEKSKYWGPPHPPLLHDLDNILIQEGLTKKLLTLVLQANNINVTLQYHKHLVKSYPEELLNHYLPALDHFGDNANGRSDYTYLVNTMKMIIKDIPGGKEKVLAIAKKLKQKYSSKPRRPAIIEELNKIL